MPRDAAHRPAVRLQDTLKPRTMVGLAAEISGEDALGCGAVGVHQDGVAGPVQGQP